MSEKQFNNEPKDEKELDNFFNDLQENKLKKTITKAKRRSILRNVVISLIVLAVVGFIGSIANNQIVYRVEAPVQIAVDNFNNISAPNQYIGKMSRYHGFLGGYNQYTTYKIIDGKVVYTGNNEYNYGLFQSEWGNKIGVESPAIIGTSYDTESLETQRYNELGQREMVFFYPFIEYSKYKNDLQLLDQLESNNKIMEVALSFDKSYSMDEVKGMLPNDVNLAWYWIDDLSKAEKEASKPQVNKIEGTSEEIKSPARIRSEKTAYGIKAYNESGEDLENPLQNFIWSLEKGTKYDTRYKGEFERVSQNIAGEDGKITKEDIKVYGAVVTGDTNILKSLHNLPFIKASSLGVITDRY